MKITITKKLLDGQKLLTSTCGDWYTNGRWAVHKDYVDISRLAQKHHDPELRPSVSKLLSDTINRYPIKPTLWYCRQQRLSSCACVHVGVCPEKSAPIVWGIVFVNELYLPFLGLGRPVGASPTDAVHVLYDDKVIAIVMPVKVNMEMNHD